MNVSHLMTTAVKSCTIHDNLEHAAQLMWETDCGAVPVVDVEGHVVGMITDRDICMAAYTHGQALWQIPVSDSMARNVHAVRETDSIDDVEALMGRARVRRVPVLDGDGRLKGVVSMNDLVRHAQSSAGRKADSLSDDHIVRTLAAICEPRSAADRMAATR